MNPNEYNANNALTRINRSQLQKYNSSNPIIQFTGAIVRVEESVKTVWSNECNKSAIFRAEFEAWDEYDQKYG